MDKGVLGADWRGGRVEPRVASIVVAAASAEAEAEAEAERREVCNLAKSPTP
jgi:hypothetical protein